MGGFSFQKLIIGQGFIRHCQRFDKMSPL